MEDVRGMCRHIHRWPSQEAEGSLRHKSRIHTKVRERRGRSESEMVGWGRLDGSYLNRLCRLSIKCRLTAGKNYLGNEKARARAQGVCSPCFWAAGWGGREGPGREEEPIPASPASPSTQWWLLSRSPGQIKWWGLPAALRHRRDVWDLTRVSQILAEALQFGFCTLSLCTLWSGLSFPSCHTYLVMLVAVVTYIKHNHTHKKEKKKWGINITSLWEDQTCVCEKLCPKEPLFPVRIQAAFVLKGETCVWLLETSWFLKSLVLHVNLVAMFLSTSGKTNAILCFATLYVCRNGEVLYPQRSEPWEWALVYFRVQATLTCRESNR